MFISHSCYMSIHSEWAASLPCIFSLQDTSWRRLCHSNHHSNHRCYPGRGRNIEIVNCLLKFPPRSHIHRFCPCATDQNKRWAVTEACPHVSSVTWVSLGPQCKSQQADSLPPRMPVSLFYSQGISRAFHTRVWSRNTRMLMPQGQPTNIGGCELVINAPVSLSSDSTMMRHNPRGFFGVPNNHP